MVLVVVMRRRAASSNDSASSSGRMERERETWYPPLKDGVGPVVHAVPVLGPQHLRRPGAGGRVVLCVLDHSLRKDGSSIQGRSRRAAVRDPAPAASSRADRRVQGRIFRSGEGLGLHAHAGPPQTDHGWRGVTFHAVLEQRCRAVCEPGGARVTDTQVDSKKQLEKQLKQACEG